MGIPRVSVIVPTDGRLEYLERAIESVHRQSYDEVELVVVANCKREPIEAIVEDYDGFETVHVRRDSGQGPSIARNIGIESSSGEYVAFLDDDDIWHREKLETQLSTLTNAGEDARVAYTGVKQLNESGEMNSIEDKTHSNDIYRELLGGNYVRTFSCILLERELVSEIGLLDEALPHFEDWDLYLRASQKCDFVGTSAALVDRFSHDEQLSADFDTRRIKAGNYLISKHRDRLLEEGRFTARRFESNVYAAILAAALKTRKFQVARKYAMMTFKTYPLNKRWPLLAVLALGGNPALKSAQMVKRKLIRSTNTDSDDR